MEDLTNGSNGSKVLRIERNKDGQKIAKIICNLGQIDYNQNYIWTVKTEISS